MSVDPDVRQLVRGLPITMKGADVARQGGWKEDGTQQYCSVASPRLVGLLCRCDVWPFLPSRFMKIPGCSCRPQMMPCIIDRP